MTDHDLGGDPARRRLEQAIAAQEGLRAALGDSIVDTTIAALRAQLDRLEPAARTGPRRRVVTVVFVDVADSTEMFRDRDPEETMAIMDSALERLAGPIRAFGGRVTRFMGDGYLAVFGLPVSREDDPEMAVRAGLAVQAKAAEIGGDLRTRGIAPFSVRVGINTGLVVSGGTTEAEDTIMGSEVNIAARLEAAAPPGGVLISHGTFQHVRDRCAAEPYGEITAKGLPAPIPAFLVTGVIEEPLRGARPVIDGITTPMVGREAELAALGDALTGARSDGRLRVLAVSGESGAGKSRLIREFEDGLGPGVRRFRARAGPGDRNVPYALVRDLLARHLGIAIGDTIAEVRRKLGEGLAPRLGQDGEERAVLIGRLAGFSLGGPVDDPERLRDRALSSLAEFLSPDRQATLLVAEDLQWADGASLEALARLADHLTGTPTLLIVSARPEFWADGIAPVLDRHRVDIGPLGDEAAGLLVDGVLGSIEGETFRLRRLLLTGAEGNPYFLEEILRMLVDDGVLVRSQSGWAVAPARLTDLRVPPTLGGVVQARLDALGDAERSVLQQASVVGRVFWDEAVGELAGGDVGNVLGHLVRRDMVVRHEASSIAGTVEYAFRHNVLREVVYESVLLDDRRSLHSAAADWLLERTRGRSGESTGIIATHLEQAGRDAEALEFLTAAAEGARSGYAVDAAAGFFDRALALVTPHDLDRRYDLLFGRQEISGLQGDHRSRRRALSELADIAGALGDAGKQALVAVECTWLEYYAGDFPAALAAAERAVLLAAKIGDGALQSRARSARAWAHLALDDLDSAGHDGRLAVSLAERAGHLAYQAAALNTLGMVALAGGDLSDASAHLERALAVARRRGDVGAESTYLNNLAVVRMLVGDFDGAERHFGRTLELAEAAGDSTGVSSASTNLAWVAAGRGEWETACAMARRALPMKRRQGHREAEAETLLWLGHALSGLGRIDEALDAYRASLAIRDDLGQTALALGARAGMARAELARGETAAALSLVDPILAHLDAGGSLDGTWEPLRIHLTCVDVLEAADDGRRDRALARAAAELEERAARVTDAGDRRTLLEDVPWHRRIVELASTDR